MFLHCMNLIFRTFRCFFSTSVPVSKQLPDPETMTMTIFCSITAQADASLSLHCPMKSTVTTLSIEALAST